MRQYSLRFYCFPDWKILYMTIPSLLGGSVMILDMYPLVIGGQSVRQMHAVHKTRVVLFTFMVCFGLCPLFHWVYLNGFYSVGTFPGAPTRLCFCLL
jgi:hypothetical protein